MSWYYVNKDGFTVGPKTVSELKPLYASKTITESTFVWNGTSVDTWTALKKIPTIYSELDPEKSNKKKKSRSSRANKKLLKKPSRLSVMNKLTKSKSSDDANNRSSKKSKSSRFASLKPSFNKDKSKHNKNNNNNTKSTFHHKPGKPQNHGHGPSQRHNNYNPEPLQINHRESNSSEMSVSTGNEPVIKTRGHHSKSSGNLLRPHHHNHRAPDLFSTVSADDIDEILDEIEESERKQQHVFSKIKGKLIKSYTSHTQKGANSKNKHQRSSTTKFTNSSKSKSHSNHVHGPHCTHCHHQHLPHPPTSSAQTTNKPRRHGRADSEPVVTENNQFIVDIPWGRFGATSGRKIQAENINMIRNIILSKHIDINSQNPHDGTTLLIHAIIIGDLDLVQELIRNGADYTIKDNDGDDCIDYSLLFQRYKICELLLMINKNMTNERLKRITKKWEKESEYMADNVFGKFKDNLIDFVCKTIENKGIIGDDMIFKAWYFTLHSENKVTGNDTQPHFSESKLFKTMMSAYGHCIKRGRKDRKTWEWIRKYLIQSIIWLLPHPDNDDPNDDESDDDETDVDSEEEFEELESKESKYKNNLLNTRNIAHYKGYGLYSRDNSRGSRGSGVSNKGRQSIRTVTTQRGSPTHTATSASNPSFASATNTGSAIVGGSLMMLPEESQDEYALYAAKGDDEPDFMTMDIRKEMEGDKLLSFLFL